MKLTQIQKHYGKQHVLKNIDFEFGESQIVGLIGKNGVGKTTLMKIMNENIVKYDGTFSKESNTKVGYLIENPKLYLNKTGYYNLNFFRNVLGTQVDDQYINQLIESFGIKPYINKKVKKYSMGMKQKLSIAVALMNKPQYLILDEPTNGMDPDGSIDVLKTLERVSKELNIKILISSHKLEDIELICDRTVFMKDGAIVEDYNMKDQSTYVTKFTFVQEVYNEALNILTMKYKVVASNKQESIISVEALQDYQGVLKELGNKNIYPKFIENNKTTLRDQYFNINKGVEA
ncbi:MULTISPECIES: phenol-soluble modulin export ABC transporter ATP-binding protein PmtC [Mammaliicoccus]|uniref:phenol-soluble modulin export ABC transporter ATP-binding protein PmtC n=1 Tax=Mammaliicoccus TaxID=2803850 RepID=UPI000DFE5F42|nr:ABC transporter ATP-binding protein [Mammaliicoccus fleurettii]HCN60130.1 antibiotic ABC transporter ATP-binding protein [Staphylococcus sp.]MEB7725064.1 ABC transporter ATP-binding protein [Mammaliicoccus fleurettii]MEB7807207.1 ABC transporter ATP-binding protein [Mammaliicoccus fleurettii]RIL51545.1 ATP-binding cassette domain-containing protein [Mammaliicoccus fleurettii]RTX85925.1 ABC transporter ATP-binding protein [Mammaliicoccus fleurettii]